MELTLRGRTTMHHCTARSVALAVSLVLLGLARTAQADAATRAPCSAPGRVVAADRTSALTVGSDRRAELQGTWACLVGRRRPVYVGEFVASLPQVRNGYVVAVRAPETDEGFTIYTQDLRRGKQQQFDATIRPVRVLIASGGVVFWMGARGEYVGPVRPDGTQAVADTYEVHRLTGGFRDTLLDSGPDIAPASLAASSSTAYWLHGGVPRVAGLAEAGAGAPKPVVALA